MYIGTNYHPHDWPEERWPIDIQLMKQAGFTAVRLGHLCWDSFEPDQGIYQFAWFDHVMDLFAEAGIGVVLDVSMRPAPQWVHALCPGVNIVSKSGAVQSSLTRYMEDVADPEYQYYALRFARVLADRYRAHPALMAFGLCNELGDGYPSFSSYARKRFIVWLKEKYETVDALNRAWATQRWSRKIRSFDEVSMPENEIANGSPESRLDMKRFFSDGIGTFFARLKETVEKAAPEIPTSSNHYAEKARFGFDYLKYCDRAVDYPGIGVYMGHEPQKWQDNILVNYQQRLSETGKPMWCLEFQTGGHGVYAGPQGVNRMHAMLCLIYRADMILGWTWRSMLGGEEQYLFGMLDHDGTPNANYLEYQQLAEDMKKLSNYAFPYVPNPEIGVAYSYESDWVCQISPNFYMTPYNNMLQQVHGALFDRNADYNMVDLRRMKNQYKLLIVPGHCVMDEASANTIRSYVQDGGTVLMTAYSAVVNETNQVFSTSRPGRLDDVFGIRVAGFQRIESPEVCFGDKSVRAQSKYHEILELKTASSLADYSQSGCCAVSIHHYGKGNAIYTAAEPDRSLIGLLLDYLAPILKMQNMVETPPGVVAREIKKGQLFFVNQRKETTTIALPYPCDLILSNVKNATALTLAGYDGELAVCCKQATQKGA